MEVTCYRDDETVLLDIDGRTVLEIDPIGRIEFRSPEWLLLYLKHRSVKGYKVGVDCGHESPREFASILHEALHITGADRMAQYGHPTVNMTRWRDMVRALGMNLSAEDLVRIMLCLKISRDMNQSARDNAVDLAGYAQLLDMVRGL